MEIVDFVICDDIRQEVKHKLTLVGVYGDLLKIEVADPDAFKWPAKLRLFYFVRVRYAEDERPMPGTAFDLKVSFNGEQIIGFQGTLGLFEEETRISTIAFGGPTLNFPAAGVMSLSLSMTYEGKTPFEGSPKNDVRLVLRKVATLPAPPTL